MDAKEEAQEQRSIGTFEFSLRDPSGQQHSLELVATVWGGPGTEHGDLSGIIVELSYKEGPLLSAIGGVVVEWRGTAEEKNDFCDGYIDVGGGVRKLPQQLRGLGIGTVAQSIIVLWAMNIPVRPLAGLTFAWSDVIDPVKGGVDNAANARRRRFWMNFGFTFGFDEDVIEGESLPMLSNELCLPSLISKDVRGWRLELSNELIALFREGNPD